MGLEVNAFVLICSDSAAALSEPTLNLNFPVILLVYVAHVCEL